MKDLRKKVYLTAGYNTISLGTGRKEFNPKKERPDIEHYIKEAGQGSIQKIKGAKHIDEVVFGNFMASRFNHQANLPGFAAYIDDELSGKSSIRTEGACCSGGLALLSGIKSVLSDMSDVSLVLGVEVQNTVKAMYGADILAGAGWFKKRKEGHAYFFPGQFSNRAGAYARLYGEEYTRKAMAQWYINAIHNARLCETAQEFHNQRSDEELSAFANQKPNGKYFVDHLNYADCSKVSDGASAIIVCSEEGLNKIGVSKSDAVEVVSFGQCVRNITEEPTDLTILDTIKKAADIALENANISINDLSTMEIHDCFSIAGILSIEALGFAEKGKGAQFVIDGNTQHDGYIPTNTTGGLIGWGHPTGATGVHQAVTIWEQLTDKAKEAQINVTTNKPYALSVNMGGDDVTVLATVYKKTT